MNPWDLSCRSAQVGSSSASDTLGDIRRITPSISDTKTTRTTGTVAVNYYKPLPPTSDFQQFGALQQQQHRIQLLTAPVDAKQYQHIQNTLSSINPIQLGFTLSNCGTKTLPAQTFYTPQHSHLVVDRKPAVLYSRVHQNSPSQIITTDVISSEATSPTSSSSSSSYSLSSSPASTLSSRSTSSAGCSYEPISLDASNRLQVPTNKIILLVPDLTAAIPFRRRDNTTSTTTNLTIDKDDKGARPTSPTIELLPSVETKNSQPTSAASENNDAAAAGGLRPLDKKARKKDQNRRAAHNYRRKKMEEKNRIREEEMRLVYSRVCLIGYAKEFEDSIMYILETKTKKILDKDRNVECFLCPICLKSCDTILKLRSHLNLTHSSSDISDNNEAIIH